MANPALKVPTYDDILALGEGVHAEILAGELRVHAAPSWQHGDAAMALAGDLDAPFRRGRGGPGGWWLLPETDLVMCTGDCVRPDFTGIRREKMPVLPDERPLVVDPDFVCEILSPSTRLYDETEKLEAYAAAGVQHVWHLDPHARLLTVMRHSPDGYVILRRGRPGQLLRLPPFEAIEIDIAGLFPLERTTP